MVLLPSHSAHRYCPFPQCRLLSADSFSVPLTTAKQVFLVLCVVLPLSYSSAATAFPAVRLLSTSTETFNNFSLEAFRYNFAPPPTGFFGV